MPSTVEAIEAFGENPSAFLALNSDNEFFTDAGLRGVVAFQSAGRYLLQFGGPFAPPDDYPELLARFLEFAKQRRQRVVGVQLQRSDAEIYAANGFTVNQMGASYAVDLEKFSLRGKKFVRLRNKVSRALRSGLEVTEHDGTDEEPGLAEIDAQWLRSKGRHVKELHFLVGERSGPLAERRRLFVGRIEGVAVGYISYSPVFGSTPGWLHDLSRRRPEVPPGVMEAINVTAIEAFQSEKSPWLHFGFTPFTSLDPEHEVASASRFVSRIVRLLAEHGDAVYPARQQLAYKEKWAPHAVLPEYIAFQGRPKLGAIWRLLRLTNAV
ncbi:DUF2156 domain-containing protein [Solihabitans fulvus]|uniref:DUF2156 domain-containing protein n=1 Tax=Solihabitans fulvus TaxID=1892852 RepID=A0A5B2WJ60_9PSEU|nr:DUF2156 domain-containing protein [Solihabitans fulvus]KAA2250948.1 DUF2156 domain-containing protein [Solihabitans fulvus]